MQVLPALLVFISVVVATATRYNTQDALINPRGKKVCLDQCGTVDLKCPEAFWREQHGSCHKCCSTWGETVIRVECKNVGVGNLTREDTSRKYGDMRRKEEEEVTGGRKKEEYEESR